MKSGVLALTVALFCSAASWASDGDDLLRPLHNADALRLRYFNPEVSYRTVYGVGDVNAGNVDYDVSIDCHGDCARTLAQIPGLLAQARRSPSSCFGPSYARLDMLAGKSRAAVATMDFDFSGRCLSFEGIAYRLPASLILKLHRDPVSRW